MQSNQYPSVPTLPFFCCAEGLTAMQVDTIVKAGLVLLVLGIARSLLGVRKVPFPVMSHAAPGQC